MELLKDESDLLGAETVELLAIESDNILAIDPDFARRWTVKAPDQIDNVDLPEPEGPMIEIHSPFRS